LGGEFGVWEKERALFEQEGDGFQKKTKTIRGPSKFNWPGIRLPSNKRRAEKEPRDLTGM